MNTLGTLILSVETKPELARALESSIEPVLTFVLDNAVYGTIPNFVELTTDLFSETFEIIDSLTFSNRSISSTKWRFFPRLHSCFKSKAIDYLEGTSTNPARTQISNIGQNYSPRSKITLVSAPKSSQKIKNTKTSSSTIFSQSSQQNTSAKQTKSPHVASSKPFSSTCRAK